MFTCLQENVEDILLQNINNWSHSVSARHHHWFSHSGSCSNELKTDQNCLFVVDVFVHSCSSQNHSVSSQPDSWNRIKVSPVRHHFSQLRIWVWSWNKVSEEIRSSGPSYYLVFSGALVQTPLNLSHPITSCNSLISCWGKSAESNIKNVLGSDWV